jgi:hypothetical protein
MFDRIILGSLMIGAILAIAAFAYAQGVPHHAALGIESGHKDTCVRFGPIAQTPRSVSAHFDCFGSCVDGSGLARALFTFAALVGAAMCSAFRGYHTGVTRSGGG